MKSQKQRSRSANKNRKEIIPSHTMSVKVNQQMPMQTQSHRSKERITYTLKEFNSKSKSPSVSSKGKKKHPRQHSLPFRSNTLNSDYEYNTYNDIGIGIGIESNTSSLRKLIENAKTILGTQSALLGKCTSITKLIMNTDLELDSIYNQTQVNTDQFINTLNQFKTKIETEVNEKNTKLKEDNDKFQSSILTEMNALNETIGKLGYNYVFHKFKTHNFNFSNISEYFSNTKKLLLALNKKEKERDDLIQQQQYELNKQKEVIAEYEKELMRVSEITMKQNDNDIEVNNHMQKQMQNTLHDGNSNSNDNIVSSSSSNLFNSNSFFEEYKRNKELRTDLSLDHNYTDMNITQSTIRGANERNDRNSMVDIEFKK